MPQEKLLLTEERLRELADHGVEIPPTEDELPCDDGEPMETQRHVWQMLLLIQSLWLYWKERDDVFVSGNMFVYYSLEQARNRDFRGPDFFAVQGVARRERKSWVVWQEGKGPDVVIELLSESTRAIDQGEKMLIYEDKLRVPEYFWYDPFSGELAGFRLGNGEGYRPIALDEQGRLISRQLGLALERRIGSYQGLETEWLRFVTLDGQVLPTPEEWAREEEQKAEQERQKAEQERQKAEQERQKAEQERQKAEQLESLLAEYRERFGSLEE